MVRKLFSFILIGILALSCKSNSKNYAEKNAYNSAIDKILTRIKAPDFANKKFLITDFGAIADGKSDCKSAIESAIATSSQNGGGKVVVPPGKYFCNGPIHLKSNINLHLEEGAEIIFSQNPDSYLPLQLVRWEGTEIYNYSPLIYAKDQRNIAITGKGKLNGNGEGGLFEWRYKQKPAQKIIRKMGHGLVPVNERVLGKNYYLRPSFVEMVNCENILISGVTIENSPFWVIHPVYSKNIIIMGITVNSLNINNDGIDPDSSEDILIENCTFNTGDDAIAFKSGRDQDGWRVNKPCKNVIVRNCLAGNTLHGLAFGSEMSGGIENIYIQNFIMHNVQGYAVQFKANKDRGGYIRDVNIRRVQIDTANTALFFTNNYHGYEGGQFPSEFYNIKISNLSCKYARENGIDILGLEEKPIHNIELKDINIQAENKSSRIDTVKDFRLQNVIVNEDVLKIIN